jgi:hypothetical protein
MAESRFIWKCRIIKLLLILEPLRLLVLAFMGSNQRHSSYLANFRHRILEGFSAEDISYVFIGEGFTWGPLVSRLDHASHGMGEPTEEAIRKMW